MTQQKKEVLIIIGSASENSSNEKLIENFIRLARKTMNCIIFNELSNVPHFDPKYTFDDSPVIVEKFRKLIVQCNGVVICTPEYIFSIPSRLKNILEWCVSTTVFSDKPVGIITASADGRQGHAELQMIMKTLMASFNEDTTLLIQGVKGKINDDGNIIDENTQRELRAFTQSFEDLLSNCFKGF